MRAHGARGTEFPGCAAWWLRSPAEWPGRSPEAIGNATVYERVVEARHWADKGMLGTASTLPGRLRDCLVMLEVEEGRRLRNQRDASDRDRRRKRLERGG